MACAGLEKAARPSRCEQKKNEEEREWRWSDDKMYVDRLRGAERKILGTRSVRHHLEPKIFPSGPPFQLTGTCHKALTFADRICL